MNRIAIIPARGGSKRLPRKNILDLNGRPIIAYTIEAALESGVFERVIVSTEDPDISQAALSAGAEVIMRPNELSSDTARVRDVCEHVLNVISNNHPVDFFCVLTATSALRNATDIQKSYAELQKGYDFVLSVSEYFFYPHAALIKDENNHVRYYWPEIATAKGQEMPEFIVENGAINWCRTTSFQECGELLGENTGIYKMPKYRSIDIDTEEDFFVLKAIHDMLLHKECR